MTPTSRRLVTRVTPEQYALVQEVARACSLTEAQVLRYALNDYMSDLLPHVLEGQKWPHGNGKDKQK